jgi:hypothetical protein
MEWLQRMKIIGLVGFIGAGKSTVSDILVQDYGYTKIAFADKLKDIVASVFGWPRHLLEGDSIESRNFREQIDNTWSSLLGYDVTPRLMIQLVGTEAFRNIIHDSIWIHATFNEIMKNPDKKYVIPDARFYNEILAIQNHGGKVMRVKRGPEPDWYDLAEAANSDTFLHAPEAFEELKKLNIHQSEWDWIGTEFDETIHNDSDIDALKNALNDLRL